jgi:hypothetical protein
VFCEGGDVLFAGNESGTDNGGFDSRHCQGLTSRCAFTPLTTMNHPTPDGTTRRRCRGRLRRSG